MLISCLSFVGRVNIMADKVYTVSEIKKILHPVFAKHGVKSAIFFGSYAKGKATPESDIDLLVDSDLRGLKFMTLFCGVQMP